MLYHLPCKFSIEAGNQVIVVLLIAKFASLLLDADYDY